MQHEMKTARTPRNQGSYITAFGFLFMIFSIFIASLFSKDRAFSENESRYLQQMPEFTINTLMEGTFSDDYETYLSDQFLYRDDWIGIKARLEKLLLKKDTNGVYFAKDNYLIEKHETAEMDEELIQTNIKRLSTFLSQYSEILGEDHVYAILAPTASKVLADKLPAFAQDYDQDALIDQLIESSPEGTIVDVRDILAEHAKDYVYYRTDHHWTAYGAFYAYQAFAQAAGFEPFSLEDYKVELVSNEFYGTTFSKVNLKLKSDEIYLFQSNQGNVYSVTYNMTQTTTSLFELDNLNDKDKYTVYLNGNNALVQIVSEVKNGKKLLVIKDSYAHCFVPFLADHYEEIDMVDFRYFNMNISDYIEQNGVTDILVLYNTISFAQDKNSASFLR